MAVPQQQVHNQLSQAAAEEDVGPQTLGPPGMPIHDLGTFINWWDHLSAVKGTRPFTTWANDQLLAHEPTEVRREHLRGDRYDLQGLNWVDMGTSRNAARAARSLSYHNFVSRNRSDYVWPSLDHVTTDGLYFRFRKMMIRRNALLAHFQLRSLLACPSRSVAFYPSAQGIVKLDLLSGASRLAVQSRALNKPFAVFSCVSAGHGVLMGGTLDGDYCIKSVSSEGDDFAQGTVAQYSNCFTNHLNIYSSRHSGSPQVAISSNDRQLRIMDIQTQTVVSEIGFPVALNASAVSPGRDRWLVAGDDKDAMISDAASGNMVQKLSGHTDYVSACDWSDDGWTLATSSQDMSIRIWDARRLCDTNGVHSPLYKLGTRMSAVRTLRFSPNGSGKPCLVAAESADFVNFFDTQTFSDMQSIDIFGEIGGVDFTNEGQDLNVLCTDKYRGGVLQLERVGTGFHHVLDLPRDSQPDFLGETVTSATDDHGRFRSLRRGSNIREVVEPF